MRTAARKHIGEDASVWLFGSRVAGEFGGELKRLSSKLELPASH